MFDPTGTIDPVATPARPVEQPKRADALPHPASTDRGRGAAALGGPTTAAPSLAPAALPSLQRSAGNRAVTGLVVQRKSAGAVGKRPITLIGQSGEHVGVLQQKLNAVGAATPPLVVDGEFGSKTFAATRAFQRTRKLTSDGAVGKKTWAALDAAAPGGGRAAEGGEVAVAGPDEANPVAIPNAGTSLHPTVGTGGTTSGAAVEELQQKLNRAGANPKLSVDGSLGLATTLAIRKFQRDNAITPANGVADPATWTVLDAKGAGASVGRVERQWRENVGGNPNIGMTSRYTWRLTPEGDAPTAMEVSVKIRFTTNSMKASWPGLVSAAWNKFSAVHPQRGLRIPITFKLESAATAVGADNTVDVKPGTGRANAGEWFLGDTEEANTIPHEFGHLVGLQDEYQQTAGDYQRVTGNVAPVGATTAPGTGASSTKVAEQLKKAIEGAGATGVADDDALAVLQTNGLLQGAFSQQVAGRYQKLAKQDLIQALRALNSPNEFTLVEPFTYSSGSMMGDFVAGRNHASENPHDHGVQARHLREFREYISAWGLAHGIPDRWRLTE